LEITYVSVNGNGGVDRTGTPQILGRRLDLHQFIKLHAMNRAIVNINRSSGGQISFQPALGYTFKMDASHIQMPINWQTNKVLDANEIATSQFPGVKAVPIVCVGTSTIPTDELMKNLSKRKFYSLLHSILPPLEHLSLLLSILQ
jgi:hypothetical protein